MKVIYNYPESKYWVKEARLKCGEIYEAEGELHKAEKMYEKLLELDIDSSREVTSRLNKIRERMKANH
ncbi:MAG: hypothetical protein DRH15_12170 [Deltaproteobacteria bacterium]|nr:MAG: hypothetical protein DRH15_12170 [Deltaproteobacteria bacterium]